MVLLLVAISEWHVVGFAAIIVVLILAVVVVILLRPVPAAQPRPRSAAEEPIVTQRIGTPNEPRPRSHKRIVACPECGHRTHLGKLQRHRATVHETVRRCPRCNQYIRTSRLLSHNIKQHDVHSREPLERPVLQCPHCHNKVLRRNLVMHLFRAHSVDIRPEVGRHPILAAMRRDGSDYWLIDGLNIVRFRGADEPCFEFLLALTHHLLQKDVDFLCVFGATTRASLGRFQGTYFAELCEEFIRTFPRRFSEVPPHTAASDAILDIATVFDAKIITNNQYRQHVERYPWLKTDREERICGFRIQHNSKCRQDMLVWQNETIPVPPSQRVRSFVESYKQLLAASEAKV